MRVKSCQNNNVRTFQYIGSTGLTTAAAACFEAMRLKKGRDKLNVESLLASGAGINRVVGTGRLFLLPGHPLWGESCETVDKAFNANPLSSCLFLGSDFWNWNLSI